MKKIIIGGIISLIGALWGIVILNIIANNMTSSWYTPPGRFLTTISEIGMTIPFIFSIILLIVGLLILGVEYLRKDE